MQKFNVNGNAFSAGNVRVEDVNGDHKIDGNNDRQIIGWTRPRWIVGMTNTVTYKQFDFSIFLYGRLHYMYNLSLIHISEPTRLLSISYAVFCLKKKTYSSPLFLINE